MTHHAIDQLLLPPTYTKAKAAEIRRLEKSLGVKFPAELAKIWTSHGGGPLRYDGVKPAQPLPKAHTPRSVYQIEYLPNFHAKDQIWSFEETVANAHEVWELDPKLIPLAGDGHYWTCLDYRKSAVPSVVHVETDSGEKTLVAKSFGSLLAGLIRASEEFAFAVAAPIAEVARKLESLGLQRERSGRHDRWDWKAFRPLYGDTASVKIEPNSGHHFTEVPESTLLLILAIDQNDSSKAVRQLARILGPAATLIHQPVDVPPVSLADLDREPLPKSVKLPPAFTPADVYDAARAGNLAAMKKYLKLGWKPTAPTLSRDSAIETAAAFGHTAILNLLLKHAKAQKKGKVPAARAFESAVSQKQPVSIKALVAAGHKPSRSHLAEAILSGHIPTIKALLATGLRPTKHMLWMYGDEPLGDDSDPDYREERKLYDAKMKMLRKYLPKK